MKYIITIMLTVFIITLIVVTTWAIQNNYNYVNCMRACDYQERIGSCIAECYNRKLIPRVSDD